MIVCASTSQKAPRIVCEICGVILFDGGPQSQCETSVVCDDCQKKQGGLTPNSTPPPESLKNK